MSLDAWSVLTILAMASVTYATRTVSFLLLRDRTLGPAATAILDTIPGSVLVAVIAPAFTPSHPAEYIALAVTILAATRLSFLPTVLIGIGSTALVRHLLV